MAYPMLGTAVCPETPSLMAISPYFIIGRKEKKINEPVPKPYGFSIVRTPGDIRAR
jgi:hypothetical protein